MKKLFKLTSLPKGCLTLSALLATLKVTGHISWSWWIVTLPIYGGIAIAAFLLFLLGAWIVIELLRYEL